MPLKTSSGRSNKEVVKAANKVLQGEPAAEAKPAVAAKPGEGLVCELFAVCAKSEAAKPASPATPAKPGAVEKLATLNAQLPTLTNADDIAKANKEIGKLTKDISKAQDDLKQYAGKTTSIMGLEKPFFLLKNPGLISIPLGFLMVILGSLLYRDPRAEAMWEELYVRQNTGIHAA